jgi:chorismate mutase
MDDQLQLDRIRGVLIRLEETIIFGLIERAQFKQNLVIYRKGGVGKELGDQSLVDFMLHECERAHAKVRRYQSPDEHPFFDDLPEPILPPLDYSDCPLHANAININHAIRSAYETEIVPFICEQGDDRQYGCSAVNDVHLLQALSKRIHYGKFVAESKYRQETATFDPLIRAHDADAIEDAITIKDVESELFARVLRKARTYVQALLEAGETTVGPETVKTIYERWIIPLSKVVEVQYLLERGGPTLSG